MKGGHSDSCLQEDVTCHLSHVTRLRSSAGSSVDMEGGVGRGVLLKSSLDLFFGFFFQ